MNTTHPRPLALRATIALGAGTLLALAAPLAASAHVTVSPAQAAPGSYQLVDVKVPTESDGATTVKVVIDLPTDTPIVSVRYVPVPGWTAELTTEKLPKPVTDGDDTITEAVTHVTWTADAGQGIPLGAMGVFPLSLGPIPDTGKVQFPAHQTYSDGSVVDWTATSATAEHPAPTLYVNDAPPSDEHGGTHGATASATPVAAADAASGAQPDLIARGLGIGGLVVGVIGLVVGIAATASRRRAQ
jgi:uncharacterized protein YcnI